MERSMAITLIQLQYFEALAKHCHFGRAAKACGVSQPTLSAQIQKLEELVNGSLVDRRSQPIQLTPLGVQVLAHAQRTMHSAQNLLEASRHFHMPLEGRLRLGIITTIAPYLIPRFAPELLRRFANLTLEIEEARTDQLLEKLDSGVLDAAILAVPISPNHFVQELLYREPLFAYLPEGHPKSRDLFLTSSELKLEQILLLPEGHCFRDQVLKLCGVERPNERITVKVGQFETLVRLADEGLGMTLLPQLAIDELSAIRQKRVKPIAEPRPVRQVALLTLPGNRKTGMIRALAQIVRASVPEGLRASSEQDQLLDSSK
jgi:LysR family hydrogen peroxide-inducible transcriptional activator